MNGVPEIVLGKLRCPSCHNRELRPGGETLTCGGCGRAYPVVNGVPRMVLQGPESMDWNNWSREDILATGDTYYRRSTGELPEKEASKSTARILIEKEWYHAGLELLDIGCATGHFYKSFQRMFEDEFHYSGIDITPGYLDLAAEVFPVGPERAFVQADALNLPFRDSSYELVFVNLFHFFPDATEALRETLRVAGRHVLWRTPVGEANYAIRVVQQKHFTATGTLTIDRADVDQCLYMLYTKEYIEELVDHLGAKVEFFERDEDFEDFDNTAFEEFSDIPATKTLGKLQLNGNLLLDWHYIGITL